jgi:predicted nucleic acid-binding Zn ribbon protein
MSLLPSPHSEGAYSESRELMVTQPASIRHGVARRPWIAPALETHSTFTTVTQTALLFLQASISQCFDAVTGQHVPCPPNS